jgi:hypothetical protein
MTSTIKAATLVVTEAAYQLLDVYHRPASTV